jgi:hypothetical protein
MRNEVSTFHRKVLLFDCHICFFCVCVWQYSGSTEVSTSHLLGKCWKCLSDTSNPFSSGYFSDWVSLFAQSGLD